MRGNAEINETGEDVLWWEHSRSHQNMGSSGRPAADSASLFVVYAALLIIYVIAGVNLYLTLKQNDAPVECRPCCSTALPAQSEAPGPFQTTDSMRSPEVSRRNTRSSERSGYVQRSSKAAVPSVEFFPRNDMTSADGNTMLVSSYARIPVSISMDKNKT